MTKQEIIDFIKKELRIEISADRDHCLSEEKHLRVRVLLEGKKISDSFININDLRQ